MEDSLLGEFLHYCMLMILLALHLHSRGLAE